MKLNKDKWKSVKFDELVFNISERVEPNDTSLEKYIGLEHLDSGKVKIDRYGSPNEVIGTKLKIYKGDIIFGKRRAYQRKAAVADFDAICSAHAMILRVNELTLVKDYLLAFIHSDMFMNRAVEISEGSLSPTIKWKTLANQKFPLPPLEEQKQIAALFQSIEAAMEQVDGQEKNLKALWKRLIDELVGDDPSFGNLLKGKELKTYNYCDITEKLMRKIDPLADNIERIVAGENLESEDFKIRTWQKVGEGYLGPAFHVLFKAGDILYGSRRTYLRKVSYADFNGVCANTTYVIRANEKLLLQDLLKHIMLSERFTQYSIGVSKGSTNPYINWKDLDNFSFQIPDIKTQKEIANVLDGILAIVEQLKQQKATLKLLKQKLLNEILG